MSYPKNWPPEIEYINFMHYKKSVPRKPFIKNVKIKIIDDEKHILKGEYGLFAENKLEKYQVLGEYTGIISSNGGRYVAGFNGLEKTNYFGIDALKAGNELRFINDYRNIKNDANVILKNTYIDKRPKILVVVKEDIEPDEEILLDYGNDYYNCYINIKN
tara:strand:- start:264 stop:743 length:480 start_codon:yes stop_codon:yes gene_type:complete